MTTVDALKVRIATFAREFKADVKHLYLERAGSEAVTSVLDSFDEACVSLLDDFNRLQIIRNTAKEFEVPKLSSHYWIVKYPADCECNHLFFGETDGDVQRYLNEYDERTGNDASLVSKHELKPELVAEFLYGIVGMPKAMTFIFKGKIEDFVRHSDKVNGILLDAILPK